MRLGIRTADGRLTGVTVKRTDGTTADFDADHVLAFFGLHSLLSLLRRFPVVGPGGQQVVADVEYIPLKGVLPASGAAK